MTPITTRTRHHTRSVSSKMAHSRPIFSPYSNVRQATVLLSSGSNALHVELTRNAADITPIDHIIVTFENGTSQAPQLW